MRLTLESVHRAALGGAFLGGGGGGARASGLQLGEMALAVGEPRLVRLDELREDDLIVTVSAVGAPAARDQYVKPMDYVAAVRALNERLEGRVAGLISSENGGLATLNGWFQSAVTGIPVVDATGNGRAHPTGVMGSMGLEAVADYRSIQAACGGNPATGHRLSLVVEASLAVADRIVREASVEAGGMVAVARNPVRAAYVAENGAVGSVSQAMDLGALIEAHQSEGGRAVAETLAGELGGRILAERPVRGYHVETVGGYDVGRLAVGDIDLTFWNEYMTAERGDERLATFPDLIATLDAETGTPLPSAEVADGQHVVVVAVPKGRMILGAGLRRPEALKPAEEVIQKPLAPYF
ncbi:DUF917 domain-containing protein [Limnochorda pilosa]|uniref:OsrF n=1 Tax=Limnochorda pilosa TaxID=1555112 RepID=A0A0K2SM24_LIMPI|nr:DUF917 family protein [Limnochorda pilosa]BAS28150.1 OsrF [Limnochorda pilosa]